jgi:hypothetical protein
MSARSRRRATRPAGPPTPHLVADAPGAPIPAFVLAADLAIPAWPGGLQVLRGWRGRDGIGHAFGGTFPAT